MKSLRAPRRHRVHEFVDLTFTRSRKGKSLHPLLPACSAYKQGKYTTVEICPPSKNTNINRLFEGLLTGEAQRKKNGAGCGRRRFLFREAVSFLYVALPPANISPNRSGRAIPWFAVR